MLTKEECFNKLRNLKGIQECIEGHINAVGYMALTGAIENYEQLIEEHFEPVELLKKHELKKVEKPSLLINEEFVESKEMVDHPSHYNQGKREVIEEMRILFGDEAVESFCRLNAYKYMRRAEFKGNKKEDLDKADWYMDYIEKMRGER